MLKRLIRHGNSRAIVVDKAILEAAGIPEDALFQISVNDLAACDRGCSHKMLVRNLPA